MKQASEPHFSSAAHGKNFIDETQRRTREFHKKRLDGEQADAGWHGVTCCTVISSSRRNRDGNIKSA
ncbi:hypothetical protein [Paraburkholderia acidisoli]|uniref:Uncharacterized protein n=1 Tax=Paraburkholderia acidisoli TaxID=2571748 RepID=A0A7Z2GF69_9BURK|nr:hypothetical protein [Paraburkholderia acidisoli]QGZ60415.1 hypothetical protein FAZ98_00960 [Paraburkholderia acidisoli]